MGKFWWSCPTAVGLMIQSERWRRSWLHLRRISSNRELVVFLPFPRLCPASTHCCRVGRARILQQLEFSTNLFHCGCFCFFVAGPHWGDSNQSPLIVCFTSSACENLGLSLHGTQFVQRKCNWMSPQCDMITWLGILANTAKYLLGKEN